MNVFDRLRRHKHIEVQSTGANLTFQHGSECQLPARPCGCGPHYLDPVTGTPREFWVTPHPNRATRRRQARHGLGRVISKAPSKSRMHQS